ncbi:L,D-transpeptidase family protein [Quadrisphaera setariae]|uniref:Murein L,D-transpeptidase n=1 Tax=Quadrisphaera setariae TaxID=2593304 RepID=A0A5C8ZD70_9ACTN|nr:L,D-transpeptidase family protein [Quadrisphaera setariae]TXR55229.1 murein L,D-transpeptidase [Quadrisphaera setariae]
MVVGAAVAASACAPAEAAAGGAAAPPAVVEAPASPSADPSATPAAEPAAAPQLAAPSSSSEPAAQPAAQPAAEVAAPQVLRPGDRGPAVLALQQRLSDLGYWLGAPDGSYGDLTSQAVMALQGAADLRRDGLVGPAVLAALDSGVRPSATTSTGRATEVDRERGLVLFVLDGQVQLVLHTSTGTFQRYTHDGRSYLADTPAGTFRVTRAVDGWREGDLGRLYRPRYFHPDGIAVHGYGSVPAHPASHGCARVSLPAMDLVWQRDLMPVGSTVVVR